jgi:hypothetical protein
MKSAYELAMERLQAAEGGAGQAALSEEQKQQLAEVDSRYKAKIAEREIFLKQRLEEAYSAARYQDIEQIRKQMSSERARLEEEREEEKEKIRRSSR